MHLFSLTFDEFVVAVRQRWGKGLYHARAAYRQVLRHGSADIAAAPAFADNPSLASEIASACIIAPPVVSETIKDGDSEKIIFTLNDGLRIEAVVLAMPGRTTLCVSSQVGCRMGCTFCTTGSLGFQRNLVPEEICGQVWSVRHVLRRPVDNIVFMGMGEPLDNFENVTQAIRVLSDQNGFAVPHSSITVSTAGLPDGIRRLARLGWRRLCLAVSLNAARDELRARLMPLNRTWPLGELKTALRQYPLGRKGVFFIEYVLLKGVNDSGEDAAALIDFLNGLPVRVNIIGYNPGPGSGFESPGEEACRLFCTRLADAGIFVRLRNSRGAAVRAGCGQLGASAQEALR